MTLPHPEVRLLYSLHYAQQGRMKKQEKGKSNIHAEEDFVEKLEVMNLDPRLGKLIRKYQEVFVRRCPHPCLAKNWTRWTSNSNLSLKGLW